MPVRGSFKTDQPTAPADGCPSLLGSCSKAHCYDGSERNHDTCYLQLELAASIKIRGSQRSNISQQNAATLLLKRSYKTGNGALCASFGLLYFA